MNNKFAKLIPGLFTWLVILAPIWLTLIYPPLAVAFLTFIFAFALVITLQFLLGLIIGYFKYRNQTNTDWLARNQWLVEYEYAELPSPQTLPSTKNKLPFFVILVPSMNDPWSLVKNTLNALKNQNYPLKNVLVVTTLEGRDAKWAKETQAKIKKEFGKSIPNMISTIHPIEDQYPRGKAPNINWAAKKAEKWMSKNNVKAKDSLLLTFDIDTELHPEYLGAIAHRYLTTENRTHKFYSTAAFFFDNNAWESSFFPRIQGMSTSVNQLSQWIFNSHLMTTFSIYAVNFEIMQGIGFWDPYLIVDDSPTGYRLFFKHKGDFTGEPIFVPAHADCVDAKDFFKSHRELYQQQRRWGWGTVVETSVLFDGIKNTWGKIPLIKLLPKVMHHFVKINILTTSVIIISFGAGIIRLLSIDALESSLFTNVNYIISLVIGGFGITLIPVAIVKFTVFKKIPKSTPWYKKVLFVVETPLIALSTLLFNLVPYIESQTWPLFNRGLGEFKPVPKQNR